MASKLIERIESDYKTSLKSGQRTRVDALRLMKAGIQHAAIDKRGEMEDADVIRVLASQAKQRRETIESAKQTNREDVLAQATEELAILNGYLPEPPSE
ncbi:MAG TPA: GatB/YqeY domain-containing protein, partial [bacterium]